MTNGSGRATARRVPWLAATLTLAFAACAPTPAQAPAATSAPAKPAPTTAPAKPAAAASPAMAASPAAASPAAKPAAAKPTAKPATVELKSAFTTTSASMAPQWTAAEAGFFAEEGLNVSLSRIQAGAPILAALQNQDVPIAFVGAQQIIDADLKGGDYVLVGGFVDRLFSSIYVLPSITTPEQLKGGAIGVTNFGAVSHIAAMKGIESIGLKDQVTYVATGGPPETLAALLAGRIQGASFTPPDTLKAREAGFRELVDVSKLNIPTQSVAVATTRKWAREKPELVERYLRAAIKGVHKLKTDKAMAMQVLQKYSNMKDPALLEETYNFYKDIWNNDGLVSIPGVAQNIAQAAETNPDAKNAKPEQFVDMSFGEKIKASGFVQSLGN